MLKKSYVCQSCGACTTKWAGRCEECGAWNSLTEESVVSLPISSRAAAMPAKAGSGKIRGGQAMPLHSVALSDSEEAESRVPTSMAEVDRVCGGGLVRGSAVLISGDPGIGKSTLLLQLASQLSPILASVYVSGEESVRQIRLRANRLGLGQVPLQLAAETHLPTILGLFASKTPPQLVIIDSIQTLYHDEISGAPGTVSQVRACAHELIVQAKQHNCTLLIVSHVTKEGLIAGPRVLEHMVDTVLYLEGERSHQYRILRAFKNRFGASDEIGVFEMGEAGLAEVPNPSALFLNQHAEAVSGSAVFCALEGTRPLLVEIQALTAPANWGGTPRRNVVGWDSSRLAMLLAILETRTGFRFSDQEVYLNVAGGIRIQEPAADLAVAAALISALTGQPLPTGAVFCGEIGLAGEVRPVSQLTQRLKEAQKLGFLRAIAPKSTPLAGTANHSTKPTGAGAAAKAGNATAPTGQAFAMQVDEISSIRQLHRVIQTQPSKLAS
jgi:DNA repair protein RadA/Sms